MTGAGGMRFASVCSGIGAPEVAWRRLGWRPVFVSEIEPFPCAVLHRRQGAARPRFMPDPAAADSDREARRRAAAIRRMEGIPEAGPDDLPNHGDMNSFKDWPDAAFDVLVGGTPCQSFSVAGLRKGLADPRGNLALTYLAIADRYRPTWLVWENVPGVLSSFSGAPAGEDVPREGWEGDETSDFATFLWGLEKLGYGWAYRTLDAKNFGVPQQRRRVFVVGYLGDFRPAAAVLFESHGLCGHPPPRRSARSAVAGLTAAGVGTSGADDNQGRAGHLIAQAFGGNNTAGPRDVASACNAKGGSGRFDFETETFIASTLQTTCNDYSRADDFNMVTHGLRAEGFDASEDGSGRGTPLVPVHCFDARQSEVIQYGEQAGAIDTDGYSQAVAFQERAVCENPTAGPDGKGWRDDGAAYTLEARRTTQAVACFDPNQVTSPGNRSEPTPELCHTLPASAKAPVAFSCKDAAQDAGPIAPTLRAMGHDGSHANAGGQLAVLTCGDRGMSVDQAAGGMAVAVSLRGRDGGATAEASEIPPALRASQGGGDKAHVLAAASVRRLLPRECERLQGFPDDYTLIDWSARASAEKVAADVLKYYQRTGYTGEQLIRAALCPDGPRYKALGNSMAVTVVQWLGERMQWVQAELEGAGG